MTNLNGSTQYGSNSGTPSYANISSLIKSMQENANKGSNDSLNKIFGYKPVQQAGIDSQPFELNKPVSSPAPELKTSPIPSTYTQVLPANEDKWGEKTDQSVFRNWPSTLGGGQYITDPSQPGSMIKSERAIMDSKLNPGAKQKILGKLSPMDYQVDHIIPLWAGGADTLENLQVLDNATHAKKTAVQSVPLTLLANGKISLAEARVMAFNWKDKDIKGLPDEAVIDKNGGYVPLETAEKMVAKWKDDLENPKMKMADFKSSFKEEMGNFGEGWMPDVVREAVKGFVGGVTANIVPGTGASADATKVDKISNVVGNIAGTIFGLGKFAKGISWLGKAGKSLLGMKKAVTIAEDATKAAGLVKDVGSIESIGGALGKARVERLKRMAGSAGLLSLWGQLGVTGRELTGQEEADFKNHVTTFMQDVAFGGLMGASGQTLKGYTTVGLGSTALSLMEGSDIVTALSDGAIMTGLHALGYKKGLVDPKVRLGNEEAYKMSANTFNQWAGDIIPVVNKGQGVPKQLKIDIKSANNKLAEYKSKYPNDQRFANTESITNDVEALNFLENVAKRELGNTIASSNGTIPVEQIKKEMQRIVVAKNQLYNQTLPPNERQLKEWKDLVSMGSKLKPAVTGEQTKVATNNTKLLKEVPFNVSEVELPNTTGEKFINAKVPSTGYGDKVDVLSKKTIDDIAKNPDKFSKQAFIVLDNETNKVMKIIQNEQITKNGRSSITDPDSTLRIFVKEMTPEGEVVRPAGYIPQEASFNAKENPLNKLFNYVRNRWNSEISKSTSAEDLMQRINNDRSGTKIDINTASKLFENKANIKTMSDEKLSALLKPSNVEKYDSNINNATISEEMKKRGLNVLVVDYDKTFGIGGPEPRWNPENPFLSLKINDQSWLKSMALKDGKVIDGTVYTPEKKPSSPYKAPEYKEAQIFKAPESKTQVKETKAPEIKEVKAPEVKKPSEFPNVKKVSEQVKQEVKPSNKILKYENLTSKIEKPKSKTSIIDTLLKDGKITKKEADIYKAKELRYKELEKVAAERYLEPGEMGEMVSLSKDLTNLLKDKKILKLKKPSYIKNEATTRNVESILKDSLIQAESDMSVMKNKKATNDPDSYRDALLSTTKGAKSMIIDNKLNLSPERQLELTRRFNKEIDELVDRYVSGAFDGTKDLAGRKYSSKLRQFIGSEQSGELQKEINSNPSTFTLLKNKDMKLTESSLSELKENGYPEDVLNAVRDRIKLGKDTVKDSGINQLLKKGYSEKAPKKLEQEDIDSIMKMIDSPKSMEFGDKKIANMYGLKLKGEYIETDKNGNPMFSEEFKKSNPVAAKTDPLKYWGSILKKDLEANSKIKTIGSENFYKDLVKMSEEAPESWKVLGDMMTKGLKKIIVDPQEPWLKKLSGENPGKSFIFNSLMKENSPYLNKLFKTVNQYGHTLSQPKKRIVGKTKGLTKEELKKIDAETVAREQKEMEDRFAREYRSPGDELKESTKGQFDPGEREFLRASGVNVKPDFQAEKVQDLTGLEMKFPSLIYEIETGKKAPVEAIAEDAKNWLIDIQFNYLNNIKAGSKIKKPGFINWDKIKEDILKNYKSE